MYWIVFSAGLALLVLLTYLTLKLEAGIIVGFIGGMIGIATYFYFILGVDHGLYSLPKIYELTRDGMLREAVHAPCPYLRYKARGTGQVIHPEFGWTYIINPSGLPIIMSKVLYTCENELIGTPVQGYDVAPDTIRNTLLAYPSDRVALFEEAPEEVETDGPRSIEMVTVLAFPDQELNSLTDRRYHRLWIREKDDDYALYWWPS